MVRRGTKRRSSSPADSNEVTEKKRSISDKKAVQSVVAQSNPLSDSESSSDEFVRPSLSSLKPKQEALLECDFSEIEKSIFTGITRLSDSEDDDHDDDLEKTEEEKKIGVDESVSAKQTKPLALWKLRPNKNLASDSTHHDVEMKSKMKVENGVCSPKDERVAQSTPPRRQTRASKQRVQEEKEDSKSLIQKPKAPQGTTRLSKIECKASQSKSTDVSGRKGTKRLSLSVVKNEVGHEEEERHPIESTTLESLSQKASQSRSTNVSRGRGTKRLSLPVIKDEEERHPVGSAPLESLSQKKKSTTNKTPSSTSNKGNSNRSNKTSAPSSTPKKTRTKRSIDAQEEQKVSPKADGNTPKTLDQLDVAQLLALGESLGDAISSIAQPSGIPSGSESDEDWEEVEMTESKPHSFPKDGVQITVEMPETFHHRKRRHRQDEIRAEMNRALNRVRRELQILYHKVSVLGWLAHGKYVNKVVSCDVLKGLAISIIPSDSYPPAKASVSYLEKVVKWFVKQFEFSEGFSQVKSKSPLEEALVSQFVRKVAKSKRDYVLIFLSILRALDLECRLIISFQPLPLKPQSNELLAINKRVSSEKKSIAGDEQDSKTVNKASSSGCKAEHEKSVPTSISSKTTKDNKASDKKSSTSKDRLESKESPKKPVSHPSTKSAKSASTSKKSSTLDMKAVTPRQKRVQRTKGAQKSYKEESESSSDEDSSIEKKDGKSDKVLSPQKGKSLNCLEKDRLKAAAAKYLPTNKRQTNNRNVSTLNSKPSTSSKLAVDHESSDDDFQPKPPKQSPKNIKSSNPVKKTGKSLKVLSTDEDTPKRSNQKRGCDYWTEVFLEGEKRWVCVDIPQGKVDCVKEIKAQATQPVCYVIAFNQDMTLKDLTKRYVPQYSQTTVKQRADVKWWEKAIRPFKPKRTAREREEDSELDMIQLDRPMPSSIAECKNHPLYVLKRHLLKFEALYPPDAPTLGFLKNKEPLYARQNVFTLRSREIWIKEAKVVRLGEEPYKIVKARPKYDKLSGKLITDLPLELFGPWQTEDYVPPTAENGVVPRNAYGNVELFKPCMLPKGCVHLQVPGLTRVAKKLRIDCAPAVVGFDFHSGGSHPMYDGFVVCQEHVDVLLDAWNRDIDESAKRNQEKHDKRVWGNWRRLIKGLLIREHLKFRYDFNAEEEGAGTSQTNVNPEALASARIQHSVTIPQFPKLMEKVSSKHKKACTERSIKGTTGAGKRSVGKAKARRKKGESSEEEEEDWESTTTEDEGEMVLLSDEDSGSEFD